MTLNSESISSCNGSYIKLGASAEGRTISFSYPCEGEEKVSLIVYRRGETDILAEFPMEKADYEGSIRTIVLKGVSASQIEYNYRVGGRIVQDPAADVIVGRAPFGDLSDRDEHQVRCRIAQAGFKWGEDRQLSIPYADVVAYALHVRGFTMQKNSRVRHRGTFAGLKEKISYLSDLGINQVVLMPAYEFEEASRGSVVDTVASYYRYMSSDEARKGDKDHKQAAQIISHSAKKLNYWGYTTSWYFAPKFGFSATGKPDVEFKEMVKAMHAAGIEVIMEFAFDEEISMDYILQCLSHWVRDYHVDGFVLQTSQMVAELAARSELLRGAKLITGYFDTSRFYAKGRRTKTVSLADLNGGFKEDCRRLLKGDEGMLTPFVTRMKTAPADKAVYNYMASHDGFTLMDAVSYDKKHNEENGEQNRDGSSSDFSWNCGVEGPTRKKAIMSLRYRQIRNAFSMLLLSQGTPMLLAGDEFGNSQGGNNNPYCIDSEVSWVNWAALKQGAGIHEFVKQLIAFRKEHRILHTGKELSGGDTTSCGYPDFSCHGERAFYGGFEYQDRHIGLMYCGKAAGEEGFIYTAYNLHWDEKSFALPSLPKGQVWKKVIDTTGEVTDIDEKQFVLPGRCVCVLVSAAETSDEE